MSDDTPMVSALGFDPPEERVVLAAPEGVAQVDTARVEKAAADVADRSWILRRRAVPIWIVAAALIGGASLALSAQAVMRRPNRTPTVMAPARATASGSTTNPIVVRFSPIVAPSTLEQGVVELLPEPEDSTTQALPATTTVKAKQRGRAPRSTARTSSARSRGKKDPSAAHRADPFVPKRPAVLSATPVTKESANAPTRAKWVDPFAN